MNKKEKNHKKDMLSLFSRLIKVMGVSIVVVIIFSIIIILEFPGTQLYYLIVLIILEIIFIKTKIFKKK